MESYDALVVGGGAAGLSGALVLGRARRQVLVVDHGAPRNAPAAHMHGFLSRDGMPPANLLQVGREEVRRYGTTITTGSVIELVKAAGGFEASLETGQCIGARKVLVATGLRDELPDITGLRERWGRDVLHCPYCHGWEVRDQALGVIWNGPDTARFANIVRQWTSDLVLFAPDDVLAEADRPLLAARSVRVVEGGVDRVVVEGDHLTGVLMRDGRSVNRDALFVPPRLVANDSLLNGLGCLKDDLGWVMMGLNGTTSIPGVWAAGNVSNPRAQVVTAAGEGSAAAISMNADLVEDDVREAVHGSFEAPLHEGETG